MYLNPINFPQISARKINSRKTKRFDAQRSACVSSPTARLPTRPPLNCLSFFFPTRRNLITITTSQTNSPLSDVKASRSGPMVGRLQFLSAWERLSVCKLWCVCKRSRRLAVMCTSSLSWHSAASAVQAAARMCTRTWARAWTHTHTHTRNTNTERTINTIGEVINWVSSAFTIRFSSCFLIYFSVFCVNKKTNKKKTLGPPSPMH